MADIIIVAVVVVIVALAGLYIYRAKKNGARCIGCSAGEGGCSGCGCGCSGCGTEHK